MAGAPRPSKPVTLVAAGLEVLRLGDDHPALARHLGVRIPDGWPEFPEAFSYTASVLTERPDERDWWMHLFIDESIQTLVGSGGFKGPPAERTVEIGYEIAPGYRNQGYATSAASALIGVAIASTAVSEVTAHTLAEVNPSTAVLTRLGFAKVGDLVDPEVGAIWSWRLNLD